VSVAPDTPAGVLVAVVGASGAGKDTLLRGARAALAGDGRFRFLRRDITRGPDPDGEDHRPVLPAEFAARRDGGDYALWWDAHGLGYGLPAAALDAALRAGAVAVGNLSRGALPDAARRFPLRVLEVAAPPALLAARLAARGREDAVAVAARLAREAPLPPGLAAERVENDGTPEAGIERMLRALRGAASVPA